MPRSSGEFDPTTSGVTDLAARADHNFVIHVGWTLERTAGMVVQSGADLVLADSGLPCDTFNFVCRARLERSNAREAAGRAVGYFTTRRRPFSWWVGPADLPSDLGSVLREVGLEEAETELAMALPLGGLPERIPEVPGLEVRRVRSSGDLLAFSSLSAANWDPPDQQVIDFYRRVAPVLLDPGSPQWLYLGLLNGEPVATAEATVKDGTAGLFNICTRPDVRGRGIGSMLTWRPMRDAREVGADLAVLQAAPEGINLYRRLGFASFGTITEYKPPARV